MPHLLGNQFEDNERALRAKKLVSPYVLRTAFPGDGTATKNLVVTIIPYPRLQGTWSCDGCHAKQHPLHTRITSAYDKDEKGSSYCSNVCLNGHRHGWGQYAEHLRPWHVSRIEKAAGKELYIE